MSVHEDLLVADFEQCFEHMRHYDESFIRTLEFGFAGVAAVITASAALLGQYGLTPITTIAVGCLLFISGVAGFLLVVTLARNRVYFAFVARYVNELRGLYLSQSPGGVQNKAGMYVDHKSPKIFNPPSSHSLQIYFLSACNALLFAGAAVILFGVSSYVWSLAIPSYAASLLLQIAWVLYYWRERGRKKTADSAVFGRRS